MFLCYRNNWLFFKKIIFPSESFWKIWNSQAHCLDFFDHIKKKNKMPSFLCNYNDLEKMSMVCWRNASSPCLWLGCFLLAWAAFLLQGAGVCYGAEQHDKVFSASVSKVVDGDTIEVRTSGKTLRVRLWGIDTPEWQQKFSHEAKEFTRHRLAGRSVELRVKTWDSYGRLVALVMVDGHSFNAELLRQGLAWVHIYYCKEPICREWRQLEKEAKKAGRGIWQEKNPVAPWKWKQAH
jgi:endonuclease YncB( thermonuclease family)